MRTKAQKTNTKRKAPITEAGKRLEFIMNKLGLTQKEFAKTIGKTSPDINSIKNGRIKNISRDFAERIVSVYPEYNIVWVLTGGEKAFLKDMQEKQEPKINNQKNDPMKEDHEQLLKQIEELKAKISQMEADYQAKYEHQEEKLRIAEAEKNRLLGKNEAYIEMLTGANRDILNKQTNRFLKKVIHLPNPPVLDFGQHEFLRIVK